MAIVYSDRPRRWAALAAFAALPLAAALVWGQGTVPVRGKVVMEDGTLPPKPATIEQICPGRATAEIARTDKKGQYGWIATGPIGSCAWRAVMDDYASAATGFLSPDMPNFVLRKGANEAVPRAARPQWDRAVQATQAGSWVEAESILRSILEVSPNSAPVRTGLGIALSNQGKAAEARRAFEQVVEINPAYVGVYHRLAALEMDTGDWQAAAKTAAAGIRADETSSAPVLYLDVAMIRQHLRVDGAEAAARKAIELDRNHEIPQAELVLGSILESEGDAWGAAAHLRRYLELRPNVSDAASVRARIQKLDETSAAEAPAPDRDSEPAEPLPAGAALVPVPGGVKALAAMAYMSRTPSRGDFFREYCRTLVSTTLEDSSGNPLIETFLAAVKEMSGLADGKGRIVLSLEREPERDRTVRVLALLGWKATEAGGEFTVAPSDQAADSVRQQIPAALGIDEMAVANALVRLRTYPVTIPSGQAVLIEAAAWNSVVGALPPGGFAEVFVRNLKFARTYAGLAAMGPPAAAALVSGVGLRALVDQYAEALWLYGEALAVSGAGAVVPGGPEADPIWEQLAGASPRDAAAFFKALLDKDQGRLLAFYSAVSRGDAAHQRYFTRSLQRAQAFYNWYRNSEELRNGVVAVPGGRSWRRDMFRDLPLDAAGALRFPGGAEAWGLAPGAVDSALVGLASLESLPAVAKVEERRNAPLDSASVRLLAQNYAAWGPLLPYFEKLPGLGSGDFEALAAFEKTASAQPTAVRNVVLGEWHALVKLIEMGTVSGSLDAAGGARAFRRACESLSAQDFSTQAMAALRAMAGESAPLDEAVVSALLRLSPERRASFEQVRAMLQVPDLASTRGDSDNAALAALAGTVYSALLDPEMLLVSEDPLLVGKHRFVEGKRVFMPSAATALSDPPGSYFSGGFMDFEKAAKSLGGASASTSADYSGAASPNPAPAALAGEASAPRTEALFRASARLVEIYAEITDDRGRYADNLGRADFTVLDNGQPVEINTFESLDTGVSVALLLDTTGSMAASLPALRNAALKLIEDLRPIDSVAVYAFNENTFELQPFTTDKDAAKRAVLHTRFMGYTALDDALVRVTWEISGRTGKKAIVVFTDGADNRSVLTSEAAIRQARSAGVPVYAMAHGDALQDAALLKNLNTLAGATGGLAFAVHDAAEMNAVFDHVSHDVEHGYLLSFKPAAAENGAWRKLELVLRNGKGWRVRAREGYFP
jgi:VWFA-related protein